MSTGGGAARGKKVVVVIPAYNAARTIERAYREIPPGAADEVIVVDDASRDDTAEVAKRLGLDVIVHPKNMGYGAAQKTCYAEAMRRGADIVVMLHGDAQYDAKVIPEMTAILADGRADIVFGSRMKVPGAARRGGMPVAKIIVNRALTVLQNRIFGAKLTDMHTGYRAYTRGFLETIPLDTNADGFIFDSQVIAQAVAFGMKMEEVHVESRYFSEASSIGLWNGAVYTAGTLLIVFAWMLHKAGVKKSALFTPKTH